MTALIFLAMIAANAPQNIDAEQRGRIAGAVEAIGKHQPQAAIDALDITIAAYDASFKDEKRQIYCGMSPSQTLAYMMMAAAAADKGGNRTGAIAVSPNYCEAQYLKGFALIDLGRVDDARARYRRVIALAQMHSHYQVEMGQTYRLTREWPVMLEHCTRAAGYADLAQERSVKAAKGFAWRCMGFANIELGK